MNSTHKTSCIYDGALVRNSQIGAHCIIGSDSFIADSKLYRNVTIERRNMILNSIIDQYSGTGPNTTIRFAEVGKYCSISWNVSIGGAEHPINKLTTHAFPFVKEFGICENDGGGWYNINRQQLTIENDVWIAAGAQILRGVKVSNGSVIGAGAIVTHDVAPYEIWAGVPAKKIGQRFSDEMIADLIDISWWNLPEETIKSNIHLFQQELNMDILAQLKVLANARRISKK